MVHYANIIVDGIANSLFKNHFTYNDVADNALLIRLMRSSVFQYIAIIAVVSGEF